MIIKFVTLMAMEIGFGKPTYLPVKINILHIIALESQSKEHCDVKVAISGNEGRYNYIINSSCDEVQAKIEAIQR